MYLDREDAAVSTPRRSRLPALNGVPDVSARAPLDPEILRRWRGPAPAELPPPAIDPDDITGPDLPILAPARPGEGRSDPPPARQRLSRKALLLGLLAVALLV